MAVWVFWAFWSFGHIELTGCFFRGTSYLISSRNTPNLENFNLFDAISQSTCYRLKPTWYKYHMIHLPLPSISIFLYIQVYRISIVSISLSIQVYLICIYIYFYLQYIYISFIFTKVPHFSSIAKKNPPNCRSAPVAERSMSMASETKPQ